MKIDLSVVIPLYNEENNIFHIYEEIKKINFYCCVEFILVNNGSTDATKLNISKIIESFKKSENENLFILTINLDTNVNYDGGIFEGLKVAKGEFLSWTHGDLQTPLEDTIKLFHKIKNKDKVFGKGFRTNTRGFDGIISRFHENLARKILNKKMFEINAQPKMFKKRYLSLFSNPPKNYTCLDTYFYYIALINKFEIVSIDVVFKMRIYGKSKWKNNLKVFLKHILFNLLYLLKLRFINANNSIYDHNKT